MIKIKGNTTQVNQKLATLAARLRHTEKAHASIAVMLDGWVQRNFRGQGPLVGGWAPLKAGGRWKGTGKNRKFDEGAKILQDSGRLRASFVPFHNRADAGIGSEVHYADHHEFGTQTIPQRRMLPKVREVREGIVKRYVQHIKEQERRTL